MRFLISGITLFTEAMEALDHGATALIFDFRKSGKAVIAEHIREIIKKLPPFVGKAAIFADAPRYEVEEMVTFLDLDTLIFAGHEDAEYLKRWYGQKIIKAITATSGLLPVADYPADAYWLDNPTSVSFSQIEGKITKPLIVSVASQEAYNLAQQQQVWAVEIQRDSALYQRFLKGWLSV